LKKDVVKPKETADPPDLQEESDAQTKLAQPTLDKNAVVAELVPENEQPAAGPEPVEKEPDEAASNAIEMEVGQAEPLPEESVKGRIENNASSSGEAPALQDMMEEVAAVDAEDNTPVLTPTEEVVYTVETPDTALERKKQLVEMLLDDNRCVGCDLSGMDLSGKNLDEADLERANLQGANLSKADLQEANLKGADLRGADLRDADLREADLYRANLNGADITGARFEKAFIDSVYATDAIGANFEGAFRDEEQGPEHEIE